MKHNDLVDAVYEKQIATPNCLTKCNNDDCQICSENLVREYEHEIRLNMANVVKSIIHNCHATIPQETENIIFKDIDIWVEEQRGDAE